MNQLLYQTFVREIPRYDDHGTGALTDKFDDRNTYIIALWQQQVCGMMAIHDGPDYSISGAIASPSLLSELPQPLLEARIFAVAPEHRFGIVFAGLASCVFHIASAGTYGSIVITGIANRQRMYRKMGFRPIGPKVLRGDEYFVPMALDMSDVPDNVTSNLKRWVKHHSGQPGDQTPMIESETLNHTSIADVGSGRASTASGPTNGD